MRACVHCALGIDVCKHAAPPSSPVPATSAHLHPVSLYTPVRLPLQATASRAKQEASKEADRGATLAKQREEAHELCGSLQAQMQAMCTEKEALEAKAANAVARA